MVFFCVFLPDGNKLFCVQSEEGVMTMMMMMMMIVDLYSALRKAPLLRCVV